MQTSPARPGAPVTLSVSLAGAGSMAAVQWFVPLLPGVSYSAAAAGLPAGKSLTCSASPLPTPAVYVCVVAGGPGALADGPLATITFAAPPAGSYAVAIAGQLGASPGGDPVSVAASPPSTLTVLSPCDVSGDGKVDGIDVALATQAVVARAITAALDVTGDGKVDVVDLQRVIVAAGGGVCR